MPKRVGVALALVAIALLQAVLSFGQSRDVDFPGHDASRICAGISVSLPILAFRVSWTLRPRVATSFLAGLLVCARSRLDPPNVTTDLFLVMSAVVPFFTNLDRLVMPAIPILCVLAASAVSDSAERSKGRARTRATAVCELGLKSDDVVLTQDPGQAAAVLDVRAVMIPYDDPDPVEQVVLHDQPRFLRPADRRAKEANPKIDEGDDHQ